MVMAHAGFVFLAMTKTGSTAVQRQLGQHAQLVARKPPGMKHMTARTFHRLMIPVLNHYGFPRESYELVSIVREPVDWTLSWWRYRARPAAGHSSAAMSFDEFTEQVVAGGIKLGGPRRFVSSPQGEVLVERIYRYEHLDQAVSWMAGKLGVDTSPLDRVNVSPDRPAEVSERSRRLLEEFFADDAALYESAL